MTLQHFNIPMTLSRLSRYSALSVQFARLLLVATCTLPIASTYAQNAPNPAIAAKDAAVNPVVTPTVNPAVNPTLAPPLTPPPTQTPNPPPAQMENAVVKIFSTIRGPDPFRPWSKAGPQEVTGSGVVIEGNRILTNA
ncbi:MAG TPA: hypothetical protein VNW52_12610, partial [Burkholderiaceae bacterium]|nr:hypothetical protein [Burkholderiaceae bacterium]